MIAGLYRVFGCQGLGLQEKTFRSSRNFGRLVVLTADGKERIQVKKEYLDIESPMANIIGIKMNGLEYHPQKK